MLTDPCTVHVELEPREFDTLERLARLSGLEDITGLFAQLAHHVLDGVRRPGAWERPWLEQVLGTDWEDHLEPDEDSIFEHFVPTCDTCHHRQHTLPFDSERECFSCAHRRGSREAAELRGGRPLPCYIDEFTEIREREPMDEWWALGMPPAHFEARAREAGPDQHRTKERPDGGGCLGCMTGQEFLCVGCQRWRCFCRGGFERPAVLRSCCDQCSEVYTDAHEVQARRLLAVLEARTGQLEPVVDAPGFDGRPTQQRFVDAHVAGAVGRIVAATPWPPGSMGRASKRMQRRAVRLGLRVLEGAPPLTRFGVVVAGWPMFGNRPLVTDSDDYGTELLLAADGNGLLGRRAAKEARQNDDAVDHEQGRIEQRACLRWWCGTLRDVFQDRATAAMFARIPELRWLAGGEASQ